jgi:antitoxin (DNA-binding transcriptional repressor) of toxin-antitoxin stability system
MIKNVTHMIMRKKILDFTYINKYYSHDYSHKGKSMITVSKSELKAKMLEYFRKVEQSGEDIIVTNNRVPILKVSLLKKNKSPKEVFNGFQGKIKYFEDVLTDTSNEWEEK